MRFRLKVPNKSISFPTTRTPETSKARYRTHHIPSRGFLPSNCHSAFSLSCLDPNAQAHCSSLISTFSITSSSPLEPTSRSQYRDALIHHPFTYSEVAIHPFLQLFAFGDLVLLYAGAKIPTLGPSLANTSFSMCQDDLGQDGATHSGLA